MTTQLDAVRSRVLARHDRYHVQHVDLLMPFRTEKHIYARGQYSLTQLTGKVGERNRFMLRRDACDFGDVTETPTATARDYLHVNKFKPKRLRAGIEYRDFVQTPDFAIPGARFSDGVYLDIRAAYFSIVSLVGWNCDYALGRWFVAGRSVDDFPFAQNRIARNSLVTSAEKKNSMPRLVPPGRIEFQNSFNELMNLNLITIVSDVLHALAWLARDAGAVYANTDGYVCPTQNIADAVAARVANFGLESRAKFAGAGGVAGMTSYQVGNFRTANYNPPAAVQSPRANIDDLGLQNIIWLEKNLGYAAHRRRKT